MLKINKELLKSIVRLAADGAHYNEMFTAEDDLMVLYERLNHEPVQLSNATGRGYDIPPRPKTYNSVFIECLINLSCDTCRMRKECKMFKQLTGYVPIQFIDIPNDLAEVIE